MEKSKKIKVGIVSPPDKGNNFRGVGSYTRGMVDILKGNDKVILEELDLGEENESFDIVHFPYYDPFFLTLPKNRKTVTFVTVHDLIPLSFPQEFPAGLRGKLKWLIQKNSIRNKDLIITDSIASKKDIHKYLGGSVPVEVVYPGVSSSFRILKSSEQLRMVKKKYKLPRKFVLYVGDINYNKNISGIIKSYSIIQKKVGIDLVLIGKAFKGKSLELTSIEGLIRKEGLKGKIHKLGYVEESDLVAIYNIASVYLQPSIAEGFGLPVLEAMSCGCPVVTSSISSLSEIAGDSALTGNPKDVYEIASLVEKLLRDNKLRNKMVQKGLKRVRQFSWKNFSLKMVRLYRQYSR